MEALVNMARQSKWYAIEANALHRVALADARSERHSLEAYRLQDRADTRRSKAWRSRDMKLAQAAFARADRAYRDRQSWQGIADNARRKIEALERTQRKRREEPKPRRGKHHEYILKVQYDSRKKGKRNRKHHAVWWDVRFRKRDGSPASKRELQDLVRAVRRGELPFEWERMAIAWDRGDRSQLGLWEAEPLRTARGEKEADNALASLSSTLGRDAGYDFVFEDDEGHIVVGEEIR
jgi:hypothetical protein